MSRGRMVTPLKLRHAEFVLGPSPSYGSAVTVESSDVGRHAKLPLTCTLPTGYGLGMPSLPALLFVLNLPVMQNRYL